VMVMAGAWLGVVVLRLAWQKSRPKAVGSRRKAINRKWR